MYDLEQEKQSLHDFLIEQYRIFDEQQEVYLKYIGLPASLSICVRNLATQAGTYAALKIMQQAMQTENEETFTLGEADFEYITEMHNGLVDVLVDEVIPSFDENLCDILAQEDFAKLVDDAFEGAMGTFLSE